MGYLSFTGLGLSHMGNPFIIIELLPVIITSANSRGANLWFSGDVLGNPIDFEKVAWGNADDARCGYPR